MPPASTRPAVRPRRRDHPPSRDARAGATESALSPSLPASDAHFPGPTALLLREVGATIAPIGMTIRTDLTETTAVDLHEPLLTADQIAGLLAVPRSSVYEYARRQTNPLPSIGVGRHRRFYRSHVEAWLTRMAS